MARVQLSVEENNRNVSLSDNEIQELLGLYWTLPNTSNNPPSNNDSVPRDTIELIDPKDCGIDKSDLDRYLPGHRSSKSHSINNRSGHYDVSHMFGQAAYNDAPMLSNIKHVPLSQSVDVTMPKKPKDSSTGIKIVYDLEPIHKPRYKSDCFSQNGNIRKPRYVADRFGNHFVTLEVPADIQGWIRVDWVTLPNANGIRYSMPYKFQISNESLDIADCNPVYESIKTDHSGFMKLFLVLIKSKQEELKNVQTLDLFQRVVDTMDITNFEQMPPLMPKQLIQQYQLNKSQLAFTICTLDPTGANCVPDWNTTIYSSILTEIPSDNYKKRKATCPRCSYSFEVTMDDADDIGHEKPVKKRKKCS